MSLKTVAIDFDGVIHSYSKGWYDGSVYDKPVDGTEEALLYLLDNYSVFIFTSRDVNQVLEWMNKNFPGISVEIIQDETFWNKEGVIGITNKKLPAVAYIDDRAIRFTNWNETLELLESYK